MPPLLPQNLKTAGTQRIKYFLLISDIWSMECLLLGLTPKRLPQTLQQQKDPPANPGSKYSAKNDARGQEWEPACHPNCHPDLSCKSAFRALRNQHPWFDVEVGLCTGHSTRGKGSQCKQQKSAVTGVVVDRHIFIFYFTGALIYS